MVELGTVHATIAVTDIERAMAFYGGILGLSAKERRSGGVVYESGGTWMLVYPSSTAGTNQATTMTFEVDDIDPVVEELIGRGVTFEQYDVPGLRTDQRGVAEIEGERAAWFRDPDGNILAIGQRT
jgi:catechol 2,3-dioxygenase-like lactoylglutathione lyase family enzyme